MRRTQKEKKIVNKYIFTGILVLVLITATLLALRYQVEGEKNLPFTLSKIMIVSSAEGINAEGASEKWNLSIMQNSDIYINISKNKNYKENEIIDSIKLVNFSITKGPQIGKIKLYKPSATNQEKTYDYKAEDEITEKLEYKGSSEPSIKNLEIANQGGLLLLRATNETQQQYISNDDTEVRHDGTLFKKVNCNDIEALKYEISFDLIMKMKSEKKYKTTIHLELPVGNIIEQGVADLEITDFSDVVFKRVDNKEDRE